MEIAVAAWNGERYYFFACCYVIKSGCTHQLWSFITDIWTFIFTIYCMENKPQYYINIWCAFQTRRSMDTNPTSHFNVNHSESYSSTLNQFSVLVAISSHIICSGTCMFTVYFYDRLVYCVCKFRPIGLVISLACYLYSQIWFFPVVCNNATILAVSLLRFDTQVTGLLLIWPVLHCTVMQQP